MPQSGGKTWAYRSCVAASIARAGVAVIGDGPAIFASSRHRIHSPRHSTVLSIFQCWGTSGAAAKRPRLWFVEESSVSRAGKPVMSESSQILARDGSESVGGSSLKKNSSSRSIVIEITQRHGCRGRDIVNICHPFVFKRMHSLAPSRGSAGIDGFRFARRPGLTGFWRPWDAGMPPAPVRVARSQIRSVTMPPDRDSGTILEISGQAWRPFQIRPGPDGDLPDRGRRGRDQRGQKQTGIDMDRFLQMRDRFLRVLGFQQRSGAVKLRRRLCWGHAGRAQRRHRNQSEF